jgi:predicted RNA binding protein YcfA (HicA-like mRNA interferase family)
MSNPTFATLERFLHQLGFNTSSVPGSHIVFEHPSVGVRIVLRPYQLEDTVEAAALGYVRRTLDEWGILARERFEDELRQRSRAG